MASINLLRKIVNNGWTIAVRRNIVRGIGKNNFDEIINYAKKLEMTGDVFEYSKAEKYLLPSSVERTKEILKPQGVETAVKTVQKSITQINKSADDILKNLRRNYSAEYVETRTPEIVENVRLGNITTAGEHDYFQYKTLENFRKENPEAFVFLGEEIGSALDLQTMMMNYGKTPIKILKNKSIDETRKVFNEIFDLYQSKGSFEPSFEDYINMLIIREYNPKTYKFLLDTKDTPIFSMVAGWGAVFDQVPSVTMLKNITPKQIKTMASDRLPPMRNIGNYVESSDTFVRNKKAVQELSEDLSKYRLSSDVELYRGDKTVGMFDSINLDTDFQKGIKQLLEANKENALKMQVTTYSGLYLDAPSTNLYDFLSSKKQFTLADAMQVAKFGDEKFINELIRKIKNTKLIDTRFKSFSFDEGMANGWRCIHSGDNTIILQKATIKQGTQGGYHQGANAQYEVILNNTPKEIKFSDVVYNKETDTFELSSILRNL